MEKIMARGTGRRKTGVARVIIREGTGDININKKKAEKEPNIFQILLQSLYVTTDSLARNSLENADIVLWLVDCSELPGPGDQAVRPHQVHAQIAAQLGHRAKLPGIVLLRGEGDGGAHTAGAGSYAGRRSHTAIGPRTTRTPSRRPTRPSSAPTRSCPSAATTPWAFATTPTR